MDQNAGIKSAAFKRSIQKKKEKERHFLNEVSYGCTLGFRSSGPATTTLFGLTNRFTCMWNSFQRSTPEIYTFTREWTENDLISTETESIKCDANTIKKKTQKLWEVILFSHQVMSHSSVTPWTIGPQAPVSMILQARILRRVAISFSRGSSQPRDWTYISCIGRQVLYHWVTREWWENQVGTFILRRLNFQVKGYSGVLDG